MACSSGVPAFGWPTSWNDHSQAWIWHCYCSARAPSMAPRYLNKTQTPSRGIQGHFIPWLGPNVPPHVFFYSPILPCIRTKQNHLQFDGTNTAPSSLRVPPRLLPWLASSPPNLRLAQYCMPFRIQLKLPSYKTPPLPHPTYFWYILFLITALHAHFTQHQETERKGQKHRLWGQTACLQALAPPFTHYANSSKFYNCLVPQFPHL